jgi:hypothetical protein
MAVVLQSIKDAFGDEPRSIRELLQHALVLAMSCSPRTFDATDWFKDLKARLRVAQAARNYDAVERERLERAPYMERLKAILDTLKEKEDEAGEAGYRSLLAHIYKEHPPQGHYAGKTMGDPPPNGSTQRWRMVLLKAIRHYHPDKNPFEGDETAKEWAVLAGEIVRAITTKWNEFFSACGAASL